MGRPGRTLGRYALATALGQTNALLAAGRRAGLRPARARLGEQGWLVAAKREGSVVVAWRRQNAIGEILLIGRLLPPQLSRVAVQFASVADAHMAGVLG